MRLFIQQSIPKLIIFLSFLTYLTSCNSSSSHLKGYQTKTLTLNTGEKLTIYIADSAEKQVRGLSNIQDKDFSNNEGMLFLGEGMSPRQFWMPETFFDLDIFFLTEDFYVLDIHRNLKHSPSKSRDRSSVPLSKEVVSQHVLEIKSSSPLAKKIKRGMILKLNSENL